MDKFCRNKECRILLTADNRAPKYQGLQCLDCVRKEKARWIREKRRALGAKPRDTYVIDDNGRECTRCKQYKIWDDFYEHQDKKNAQCKLCWRVTCWEGRIRRNFGLSPDEYQWLLNLQDSLCALCEQPEVKSSYNQSEGEVQRFAVDHWHQCLNHVESKGCKSCIRGLLCSSCNVLLGHVEGRKLLEDRFADYLSRRPFPIIR